ncbi:helix-turn-helix domain-containing protein [Saccharospirillum mangrovi]|uniref:helix-turn-helix domain-containing protein n=1 Tax=Saccharospirillum mangrovi TaxID=2161747 RepID=UPI000D3BA45B|nr:helix-turn-helix transcriptional regulator [Saccharospirillum mangrovi]
MSQTAQLVETLKRILRERKITYADVAQHLDLSEANVKRMFSKRHFTLARLEEVCSLAGTDLGYLMARMHERAMNLDELTEAGEAELVSNPKLLLMAQLMVNRWPYEDIIATYQIEEDEACELLAQLESLGVLERLPGNQVQTKISRDFCWIQNGPVHQFFRQHISSEFFDCNFDPRLGELLVFVGGMLSRESNQRMQNAIRRLAKEFDQMSLEDSQLPLDETFGTGMVLAMRPWELSIFTRMRRGPILKKF